MAPKVRKRPSAAAKAAESTRRLLEDARNARAAKAAGSAATQGQVGSPGDGHAMEFSTLLMHNARGQTSMGVPPEFLEHDSSQLILPAPEIDLGSMESLGREASTTVAMASSPSVALACPPVAFAVDNEAGFGEQSKAGGRKWHHLARGASSAFASSPVPSHVVVSSASPALAPSAVASGLAEDETQEAQVDDADAETLKGDDDDQGREAEGLTGATDEEAEEEEQGQKDEPLDDGGDEARAEDCTGGEAGGRG